MFSMMLSGLLFMLQFQVCRRSFTVPPHPRLRSGHGLKSFFLVLVLLPAAVGSWSCCMSQFYWSFSSWFDSWILRWSLHGQPQSFNYQLCYRSIIPSLFQKREDRSLQIFNYRIHLERSSNNTFLDFKMRTVATNNQPGETLEPPRMKETESFSL